jgi:O-methyltransferase involved in polyketide biosynthesis
MDAETEGGVESDGEDRTQYDLVNEVQDNLPPVSRTALYTLLLRAWDAESDRPLVADPHAAALLRPWRALVLEAGFEAAFGPLRTRNACILVRHAMIDDAIRAYASDSASRTRTPVVVLMGAGFDSRAFRGLTSVTVDDSFSHNRNKNKKNKKNKKNFNKNKIRSGDGNDEMKILEAQNVRWVELDDPATIEFKERALPADACPEPLVRRGIRWADALQHTETDAGDKKTLLEVALRDAVAVAAGAGEGVVVPLVVYEGVLMYIAPEIVRETLAAVQRALPHHRLVCDLMSAHVRDVWSRRIHRALAATSNGASFVGCTRAPWADIAQLGYASRGLVSITEEACRRGALPQPAFGLHVPPFRQLRRGYAVWTFEFEFEGRKEGNDI